MATANVLVQQRDWGVEFDAIVEDFDEPTTEAVAFAGGVCLAGEAAQEWDTEARFKTWLGSLATQRQVEIVRNEDKTNLLDKLRKAEKGDPEALAMVDINVGMATLEGCFKRDQVTLIELEQNEDGELTQYGQSMRSVHANSLTMRPDRHPILQEITQIEALNGYYIKDFLDAGVLDTHYFLAVSTVPEKVPEKQLGHEGDGYFLGSLTFVAQLTTKQANGKVTTESGFMAGVDAEEGDSLEDLMAERHDIPTLSKMYQSLDKQVPETAAGFLGNGLLIPKSMMPNGVTDFMRWYDQTRGIEHAPEHYDQIREESKRREASLADVRQAVRDELLAHTNELATPMDAVRLLWKLVKKHTVEASFQNKHIDPSVFGHEAAGYIWEVRRQIQDGTDYFLLEELRQKAHDVAVVSGCGGGDSAEGKNGRTANGADGGDETNSGGGEGLGPMKFTCPKCHEVNYRLDRKKLNSHCLKCGQDVSCGASRHMLIDTSPEGLRSMTSKMLESLDAYLVAEATKRERDEQVRAEAAAKVESAFDELR